MGLSREELIWYLENPGSWDGLFARAREVREQTFGNQVFAYGFDYFSTYCKNSCAFCLYRSGNDAAPRYRHNVEEIVCSAGLLAQSGVHLIDLTMGEDPYFLDDPHLLADVVGAVAVQTQLPVMISPGVVKDDSALDELHRAGAVWLALYQETFNRSQFARLRVGQDFDERMEAKRRARRAGLLIEEGILIGWGDTSEEIAESLLHICDASPSQVRVMTFVPQEGTPLSSVAEQERGRELAVIALLRIMHPNLLVPASLDVEGPAGLHARLDAGANVITSIIPPDSGLGGVARNRDIEDGARTLAQIMPIVHSAGLALASQQSYARYLEQERMRLLAENRVEVGDGR